MSASDQDKKVPVGQASGDVAAFLEKARTLSALKPKRERNGRLIFALDATLSRQPTWDMACHIQGEMFDAVQSIGTLEVQLAYYRGFRECRTSKWAKDGSSLARFMSGIHCQGGRTQISRILNHARQEQKKQALDGLVFIGDAMEEEADILCDRAGELGLLGVPVFIFQEGRDGKVERTFREIARLSKGAYARFDQQSADKLISLLRAVAVYAAGGMTALEAQGDRLLIPQMKGKGR